MDLLHKLKSKDNKKLVKKILIKTHSNSYEWICNKIAKVHKINLKLIPSYYIIMKHYCKFIYCILVYLPYYEYLLLKSDHKAIIKSDSINYFLGKKKKVKNKYFTQIIGGSTKIHTLMVEKLRR